MSYLKIILMKKGGIEMLEKILMIMVISFPILSLVLLLYCACKVSSMCSQIEELEEIKRV